MEKPNLKTPRPRKQNSETIRIKTKYIKKGYKHRISIYGAVTDNKIERSYYRRIEVLSNTRYTPNIIDKIRNFFYVMIPQHPYTIWIYNLRKKALKQVW